MTDTSLIDVVTPADPWAGRPTLSRGVVPRPRLVAALAATGPGCVAVLAAPAGYGKTTLLCQWEAADARPFAWLGLDSRDDEDPARLAERLAALLGGLPADEPFVLVLDDAHVLGGTPARLALRRIVAELPAAAVVAIATRGEAPLPLARLRAQQRLVELGAGRLAMTREETAELLGLGDRRFAADELDVLARLTEGWPGGLSLALIAVADGRAPAQLTGADPYFADYLDDEILSALTPAERVFLRRSSVLCRCRAPPATSSWSGTAPRRCSRASRGPTCCSCRSTVAASATACTRCWVTRWRRS